jgi:hypothetical protein
VVGDTPRGARCSSRRSARQTEIGRCGAVSKREWSTPVRADWCPLIHQALQAIDRHNMLWISSGDRWHLQQAQVLREYVSGLKTWIHQQEGR